MFNSIEVRLPFLNTKLLDFVQSLPTNYLIKRNNRKKILKYSFLEIFGSNFLNRKKQVFLLPVRKWLIKGELNEDLRYLINFQKDFDKNVVFSLLKKHEKSYKDHSVILVYICLCKMENELKYDDKKIFNLHWGRKGGGTNSIELCKQFLKFKDFESIYVQINVNY